MMAQDWRDLTFLHWAVPPDRLERYMPPGVHPDTFEGKSYVGLVPFRMVDAGFGGRHPVPWAGTFLETNVRLYSVDQYGRRGVLFLSLDCNRSIVVAGARATLAVPYRWARMTHSVTHAESVDEHTYTARVRWPGVKATSRIRVRVGDQQTRTPLMDFLSARWGAHTAPWGRTIYVPNTHEPWPIRSAEVIELDDGLVRSVGLGDLAQRAPDHVAFSDGVHAQFGLPTRASRPRR
ncbi:MAG: DUF2071 domain-containing protein [Nocardioidaceae bacterium]